MILTVGLLAFIVAGTAWAAVLGFRSGDRALDVTVSAGLGDPGQPDEPRPVVIADIANPSGDAVVVGLAARAARAPFLLARLQPKRVTVPWLTRRRALRAGRFETVGVVAAGSAERLAAPVAATARAYWLTVAAGQSGGRLRVCRVLVREQAPVRRWSLT
jgi:hypothetical protein